MGHTPQPSISKTWTLHKPPKRGRLTAPRNQLVLYVVAIEIFLWLVVVVVVIVVAAAAAVVAVVVVAAVVAVVEVVSSQ